MEKGVSIHIPGGERWDFFLLDKSKGFRWNWAAINLTKNEDSRSSATTAMYTGNGCSKSDHTFKCEIEFDAEKVRTFGKDKDARKAA